MARQFLYLYLNEKSMLSRLLTLLLALIALQAPAQGTRLQGAVYDRESGLPIPDVTVYLNGTTRGTTTDSEGVFYLAGIPVPCELILSHVSYELQSLYIEDTSGLVGLSFYLNMRIISLQEIKIVHDSTRLDYLGPFKLWFLGENYKKTGARILNDSVLYFIPIEGDQFEAYAKEPLEIDLPETGYQIKIDLVHFKLTVKEELGNYHCSILGYFYFHEIPVFSRRQQRDLARSRVEAYYNSRLHFYRSLYEDRLTENGFELERDCIDEENTDAHTPGQGDFQHWYSDEGHGISVLYLTGFPCPSFNIKYYHARGNRPVDLTYLYAHPSNLAESALYFAKDTIRIYSTGRVAENSILFSGAIAEKGVAWMLPEEYIPSMQ